MKMLKNSTSGLRRSLGLGLVALALSIVPAGQASATVTITDLNGSDGFTLGPQSSTGDGLVVAESISESNLSYYSGPFGLGSGLSLVNNAGGYFNKQIVATAPSAGDDVWTFTVKNNSNYTFSDYHFAFYSDAGFTNGINITNAFKGLTTSDSDLNGRLVSSNKISLWAEGPSQLVAPGQTIRISMTGNLESVLPSGGTIYLRQIATVVPEPNSAMLLGIGGLIGAVMLRRKYAVEA